MTEQEQEQFINQVDWWADSLKHKEWHHQLMQIGAEYGEFLQEYELHYGTNPRKPAQRRMIQMQQELCDIIITTAVALAMVDPNNWWGELVTRINYTRIRLEEFKNES